MEKREQGSSNFVNHLLPKNHCTGYIENNMKMFESDRLCET